MFEPFPKIARLYRDIIITEKIDGTNASLLIEDGAIKGVFSRTREITPEDDNFGFARWVHENTDDLLALGDGRHFGEWFGGKIQRGYGLKEKQFALFNVTRWTEDHPAICSVVPILYTGPFMQDAIDDACDHLRDTGSEMVPGYDNPEGIVIRHSQNGAMFKVTLEDDAISKGELRQLERVASEAG